LSLALALSIHNKQQLVCIQSRLSDFLVSVGHRVKINKITPSLGKNGADDLEVKDYVVLQKPQEQTDRLPPPRTLIMDFTLTRLRYGRSNLHFRYG
jgi:hypothetical protein